MGLRVLHTGLSSISSYTSFVFVSSFFFASPSGTGVLVEAEFATAVFGGAFEPFPTGVTFAVSTGGGTDATEVGADGAVPFCGVCCWGNPCCPLKLPVDWNPP